MARKRTTNTRRSSTSTRAPRSRKSEAEARAERLTWGLLVLAFAFVQFVPHGTEGGLPNAIIPSLFALILLGSGVYQYTRRWKVSPITWIAGGVMLFFALVNMYINPNANFLGISLLVFASVILFGVITGET